MSGPLKNARHERFAQELAKGIPAIAAYETAGYKPDTGASSRLSANVSIKDRVAELLAKVAEEAKIDAAYVLRQAVKLHERCMQEVDPLLDRRGQQIRDESGNPLFYFNATGAAKALELVGKHVAVQAFRDQVGHSGKDGGPIPVEIDLSGLTPEQLRAIASVGIGDQ